MRDDVVIAVIGIILSIVMIVVGYKLAKNPAHTLKKTVSRTFIPLGWTLLVVSIIVALVLLSEKADAIQIVDK